MSRRDGRGPSQLRPLSSERGPLARADGSARFSHGGTAVLCAVYGPAEVKLRNERVDRAHIEITVKPATGSAGTKEKVLEELLHGVVLASVLAGLYPRTAIQVIVQVVHDDGSLLAAAINGAMLALLDAGISMRATVTAATAAFLPGSPDLLLDPTAEETGAAESVHTFAVANGGEGDAIVSDSVGLFTVAQLLEAREATSKASAAVVQFMRTALERSQQRQGTKRSKREDSDA